MSERNRIAEIVAEFNEDRELIGERVALENLARALARTEAHERSAGAAPLDTESYREALRDVLAEFDYWVSAPRPAVGGGTVRIHKFSEVQPSMEKVLVAAALLAAEGTDR